MKNVKRLAIIGTTQIAKSHVEAARKVGFDICHVAGRKNSSTVNEFAAANVSPPRWWHKVGSFTMVEVLDNESS